MVKIRKHIVPNSIAKNYVYSGTNSKKYIVIHETANTGKGANANAHAQLQYRGNSRKASWHYQVDDKEVVQSFNDDARCFHAGDAYYNKNSIGIEICVNSDGDFAKAVDNAVALVRYLMNKYNIPKSNVIQHNKASGKNCPRYLRSGAKGITWAQFIAKLDRADKPSINVVKPIEKPKPPTKAPAKPVTKPKQNTNKGSVRVVETLVVDGERGKKTIRRWQQFLGTPIDGVISKPTSTMIKAWQRFLNKYAGAKLVVDGIEGPKTIRAGQRFFGTPVDGKISRVSPFIKELQRFLNAYGR